MPSWSKIDFAKGEFTLSKSFLFGRGTQAIILSIWFIVDVPGNRALPASGEDWYMQVQIEDMLTFKQLCTHSLVSQTGSLKERLAGKERFDNTPTREGMFHLHIFLMADNYGPPQSNSTRAHTHTHTHTHTHMETPPHTLCHRTYEPKTWSMGICNPTPSLKLPILPVPRLPVLVASQSCMQQTRHAYEQSPGCWVSSVTTASIP